MTTIVALGAEKQAATSLAIAYPDFEIVFVSDCDILDGSDLDNVRMVRAAPGEMPKVAQSADHVVPLCPRWISENDGLSRTFERLDGLLPGCSLPLQARCPADGEWIVKGDRWHRPDAPIHGNLRHLVDVVDVHGCGLVYQRYCNPERIIMAIGRRDGPGAVLIGVIEVLEERFFRDVILQAGETIDAPDIAELSLHVLDALDHRGFFTLNWLRTLDGPKLSSLRPVPRAVFQTFRRGGVDLLAAASTVKVAAPGLRFIADPTYVSFARLCA
jgi:hypothetical protein